MGNHKARTRGYESPMAALGRELAEVVDPRTCPSRVKSWATMTEQEKAELRALYEKPPRK